jgi:hypothetical protein
MGMKVGDLVWTLTIGCIVLLLLYPASHHLLLVATGSHPFIMGFIKFAILATLGELLSSRVVTGGWIIPTGVVYRMIVWGLIGDALVVIFPVFSIGIGFLQQNGLLPSADSQSVNYLLSAFWGSLIMNIAWSPTLMLFHQICDTYLDLADGKVSRLAAISLVQVTGAIDWQTFIHFVVFKTILFFWIPAHIITFLFPPELRVLFAAFLSLALGAILGFAKRRAKGLTASSSSESA